MFPGTLGLESLGCDGIEILGTNPSFASAWTPCGGDDGLLSAKDAVQSVTVNGTDKLYAALVRAI